MAFHTVLEPHVARTDLRCLLFARVIFALTIINYLSRRFTLLSSSILSQRHCKIPKGQVKHHPADRRYTIFRRGFGGGETHSCGIRLSSPSKSEEDTQETSPVAYLHPSPGYGRFGSSGGGHHWDSGWVCPCRSVFCSWIQHVDVGVTSIGWKVQLSARAD